jgi:hypothetical protein
MQSDQRRYGGKTSVTLAKLLAFPDIAEKHAVCQISEFRRDVANHLLRC